MFKDGFANSRSYQFPNGGDPVQDAKKLHESDIQAIVSIIGFDVDNAGQQALKQVAAAGGGEYETANSAEELRQYLDTQNTEMILNWYSWDASASIKLFSNQTDRATELQHLVGFAFSTFDEKIFLENERMEEALDYLEEKKKISFEDSRTVESNLFWRKNQFRDYTNRKYWSLNKILNDNYWDLKRKIEDTRNKNIEKYQ